MHLLKNLLTGSYALLLGACAGTVDKPPELPGHAEPREYRHVSLIEGQFHFPLGYREFDRAIPFEGREIVATQHVDRYGKPYVKVPGFLSSKYYRFDCRDSGHERAVLIDGGFLVRTDFDCDEFSLVDPITDSDDRKEITELVKQYGFFRGPVTFSE